MLHQKATWNGPVYSEGNNHWYYCGLTDGNYGQDQLARLDEQPWLVDFDLRKLHPLCCNFGMGNLGMFFGRGEGLGTTPEERDQRLDRFLAATLAFGHTGFLVMEGGIPNAARSYFALQQIHANYAQQTAEEIRYADENHNLLDSTSALATGAYRRSQIVTTYSNGLKVWVNGHPTETWKTPHAELPPNGWFVEDPSGKLKAFSALVGGRRVDYVDSPAYLYADARGRFTRLPKVACDGQGVAIQQPDNTLELILIDRCTELGVSLDGRSATAVAMDEDNHPLGPVPTRFARGLVYVVPDDVQKSSSPDAPDKKAFSYSLRPTEPPDLALQCDRDEVVPGEKVEIRGKTVQVYQVPADAKPGKRLWVQQDGAWIDFTVVPLVDATLELGNQTLKLRLLPHMAAPAEAAVTLDGQTKQVRFVPGQPVEIAWPLEEPKEEQVRECKLRIEADSLRFEQSWWLKAEKTIVPVAVIPSEFRSGECLRGKAEEKLSSQTGAQVHPQQTTCGEVTRQALFMHPPYKTGVGYAWALYGPIDLPKTPAAMFRCQIGKADGSDPGDGILVRVVVVGPDGKETIATEKQWIQHAWTTLEADLSQWAGQSVKLKLIADVGPADNSAGDWAAWTDLRIESTTPVLRTTLHEKPVPLHNPNPPN